MNTVLVGAGYWGKNFERILQKKSNNLNLKYIVDANLTIDGYECFKDIEELGNVLNDIQCAIVCTPTQTHYKIVDYFLNNNINVLVEKPLATNSKDAQELLDKASKKKLVQEFPYFMLLKQKTKYKNNKISPTSKKKIVSGRLTNIKLFKFYTLIKYPIYIQ